MATRFARAPLELEKLGLSLFTLAPGFRFPFGHRHVEQEEVYLVVSGSARMKLEDETVELGEWDAVRVPPETMRGFEGGPEGCELLIIGAPNVTGDTQMTRDWWTD